MAAYVDPAPAYFDDIESDGTKQTAALEAASADIDSALRGGGYVVPVDLAAVAAEDTTLGPRIAAKIRQVCEAIAAYYLTAGAGGVGKKIQKDYEAAQAWLGKVRNGTEQLAPLTELARLGSQRFAVVSAEGAAVPADPNFPSELFAYARGGGYRL